MGSAPLRYRERNFVGDDGNVEGIKSVEKSVDCGHNIISKHFHPSTRLSSKPEGHFAAIIAQEESLRKAVQRIHALHGIQDCASPPENYDLTPTMDQDFPSDYDFDYAFDVPPLLGAAYPSTESRLHMNMVSGCDSTIRCSERSGSDVENGGDNHVTLPFHYIMGHRSDDVRELSRIDRSCRNCVSGEVTRLDVISSKSHETNTQMANFDSEQV